MKSIIRSFVLWCLLIFGIYAAVPRDFTARSTLGMSSDFPGSTEEVSPGIVSLPGNVISVYRTSDGSITELDIEEYTARALLEELPRITDGEAMKAQACAARTYAARCILAGKKENGAHISNDASKYQTCLSDKDARAVYGEEFETAYAAAKKAAYETKGQIITCGGSPAIAAFHISSGGMTESAQVVWGTDIPYLVPVSSDCTLSERTFTLRELCARILAEYGEADLTGAKVISASASGTVREVNICGVSLKGEEAARILSLDSAAFDVSADGENVIFTVKGSGHLAGMSILGADEMSRQGASYTDIIGHYYPGTGISSVG